MYNNKFYSETVSTAMDFFAPPCTYLQLKNCLSINEISLKFFTEYELV